MSKILGISAYYHDAAAALIVDGQVIAAAQEERFSRRKNDPDFPKQAIRYCLDEAACGLDDLDALVFYDKPLLKFERLLETYYAFAPKGFGSFIQSMPRWVKEQLLLKNVIRKALKEVEPYNQKRLKLLFSEHHWSHAASAFYPSPFEEAAVLTIDGVGEWATATLGRGHGHQLEILKEIHFPHSIGLLYSAFTYFLGFKVNSGEYKLMGLAAYGNENSPDFKRFYKIIAEQLADLKEDGSLRLHLKYFTYPYGLRMIKDQQWAKLFGLERRQPEDAFQNIHADLALAIQRFTEAVVFNMASELKRMTGLNQLCLAGGVALNGVANGKILQGGIFERLFVQPAAGDAGGALGAALAAHYLHFGASERSDLHPDGMSGALLGPAFLQDHCKRAIRKAGLEAKHFDDFLALAEQVASAIAGGAIVGWFQGRMEFGPRALGNRSILGDPRSEQMQSRINLSIKRRESFRPFAPVVLEEDAADYFDLPGNSPYMNLVGGLLESRLRSIPTDYPDWSIADKLAFVKSDFPAITHVDLSARIQTVDRASNFRLWNLIHTFKRQTGCGMLINTSFNGRDEPIVCSPEDAIQCFQQTEMDLLIIGDYLIQGKQFTKGK